MDLAFDSVGESIGFIRYSEVGAGAWPPGGAIRGCGRADCRMRKPYAIAAGGDQTFEVADVTGAPWVEVDFSEILPRNTGRLTSPASATIFSDNMG